MPHPAENTMHFRIQAAKDVRAIDLLRKGLEDLEKVCDHTTEVFSSAMKEFSESAND